MEMQDKMETLATGLVHFHLINMNLIWANSFVNLKKVLSEKMQSFFRANLWSGVW